MTKPNFKKEDVESVLRVSSGYCWIPNCVEKAVDIHHRLPNTKTNNKNYPVFVQSIFNMFPICRGCHDSGQIYNVRITEGQARIYEDWLKKQRGL